MISFRRRYKLIHAYNSSEYATWYTTSVVLDDDADMGSNEECLVKKASTGDYFVSLFGWCCRLNPLSRSPVYSLYIPCIFPVYSLYFFWPSFCVHFPLMFCHNFLLIFPNFSTACTTSMTTPTSRTISTTAASQRCGT